MTGLRTTTARNLYYQGLLTALTAVVGALAVLVLARVLPPAEYGLAMFAFLIVTTSETVADFGVMAAVLSRREELHASIAAAASLRVVLSLAASSALALLALLLAGPLGFTGFAPFLLPLSLVPFVSGLGFASQAHLRLALDFRRLSLAQAGGMLGSPAAQIAFALLGVGAWSIIWGVLLGHILQFALLTALRPAFFRPSFDLAAWRGLLRYGSRVIGVGLTSSAYEITAAAFVSTFAGATALGAYLLGVRVAQLVPLRAISIVNEVLLPTLSKIRAEGGNVARPYLEAVRAAVLPSAFANFAAVALALPGVLLIGGARWEPAVLSVQAMAIFGVLQAATGPATPFVQMRGRPGAALRQAGLAYALLWLLGLPAIYHLGLTGLLVVLVAIMAFAWAYVGGIVRALDGPSLREAAASAAPGVTACGASAVVTLALVSAAPLAPLAAVLAGASVYAALALAVDHAAFAGASRSRVARFARDALGRPANS